MKTITIEVNTIKEKRPNNGQICWVKPVRSYQQQLVFNSACDCWVDVDGYDDYFCKISEDDIWAPVPMLQKITNEE